MENSPYIAPQTNQHLAQYVKPGLFSFRGRISRKSFWMVVLALFVLWFLLGFGLSLYTASKLAELSEVERMIVADGGPSPVSAKVKYLVWLLYIPTWWLMLATTAKRFHDRNKSGWWNLLYFIPFVGLWNIIEGGFFEGTDGYNDYGVSPLA